MVVIIEVRLGLIWLDTDSEVIVVAAVPVIVFVIVANAVQTPGPQICPVRQQPPEPVVSWILRG